MRMAGRKAHSWAQVWRLRKKSASWLRTVVESQRYAEIGSLVFFVRGFYNNLFGHMLYCAKADKNLMDLQVFDK